MGNGFQGTAFINFGTASTGYADCTDDLIAHLQWHAATEQQQLIEGVEVLGIRVVAGTFGQQACRGFGRQCGKGFTLRRQGVVRADIVVTLYSNQVATTVDYGGNASAATVVGSGSLAGFCSGAGRSRRVPSRSERRRSSLGGVGVPGATFGRFTAMVHGEVPLM